MPPRPLAPDTPVTRLAGPRQTPRPPQPCEVQPPGTSVFVSNFPLSCTVAGAPAPNSKEHLRKGALGRGVCLRFQRGVDHTSSGRQAALHFLGLASPCNKCHTSSHFQKNAASSLRRQTSNCCCGCISGTDPLFHSPPPGAPKQSRGWDLIYLRPAPQPLPS